ncbi:DEAD/DEAH box helicase [Photobacterium leiognathi]|uniref:DEAD/DEAH box helicase n=1 Tax=Photobacterium leiognathi TaxID=553611 RepID=UPI001EE01A76|nr:DEAD/DEAH box helicase [Photobacterium leiognathi]MCG3884900.1 DEAD/DEAH box helicase [Photobacterium leiognathi]
MAKYTQTKKSAEIVKPHEQGMIVPVYKGQVGDNRKKGAPKSNKKNITSNVIAKNILLGLNENMDGATNLIYTRTGVGEAKILTDLGYPFNSMEQLLVAMHRPRSAEELTKAIKTTRLINGYKTMQDALASRSIMPMPESSIDISLKTTKQIVDSLPFTLTSDQKHAVWNCMQDISSNVPMNRLISGDVGCGKTLTYGIPLILLHLATKNKTGVSLVLTHNSLLAMQIEKELREIAPQFNVRTKLIVAGDKNVSKIDQNTILVGTTALIHYMKKHGKHLSVDMLVIDEQQKLGSEQRNKLIQRHTNVLQATATAIPRTTAQIMFGAMDISIIEQCPVKKQLTHWLQASSQKKIL